MKSVVLVLFYAVGSIIAALTGFGAFRDDSLMFRSGLKDRMLVVFVIIQDLTPTSARPMCSQSVSVSFIMIAGSLPCFFFV